MNQDKGRNVALIDRTVYLEKCVDILDINQFTKLSTNLTKKTEEKFQGDLQTLKSSSSALEYPAGSCLGNVDQLSLRPIMFNIRTSIYQMAKYLAKLLCPLTQS